MRSGPVALAILLLAAVPCAASQTYNATVGNNFFSPQDLTITVGDTVRWTNASGFHNVFSCNRDQIGCDGADATEAFSSGPPADPLWIYSHTFTVAGANPYLCQSHATSMHGSVTVLAAPPPEVPDGVVGAPMTVTRLGGSSLSIAWDTATCPGAADHLLLYGTSAQWPSSRGSFYGLSGSRCALGPLSPFTWDAPAAGPGEVLWWLVVATDGVNQEGSWGRDSSGRERRGPAPGGASGECGISGKDLTSPCGP